MRALLSLVAIAVVVLIVLVMTGFVNIGQTQQAELPRVEGGQAPKFDVDVGKVDVRTENRTVEVPVIDIDKPGQDAAEGTGN
jgi:hypothetical protein